MTFNRQAGQTFAHCRPWRASVSEYLRTKGVDLVVLSQYFALLAADGQGAVPAATWSEQLPTLLDLLRSDGIEPVIMGDSADPSQATLRSVSPIRPDRWLCGRPVPGGGRQSQCA